MTVTAADPDADTPLESVTLKDSVLSPFTGSVTWKLPVPEYGLVPPAAETLQLNGFPAVAPESQVTVTTRGWAPIATVAEPDAVTPLASVTLNVSVFDPFVASVRLKVPIPLYGVVPPVAETVQLNGLPAVTPVVGQETVTTGWLCATDRSSSSVRCGSACRGDCAIKCLARR